jgi:uncharacterized membrane protein
MAAKDKIIADLDFITDRISTQVRTVSLSVMATVWLFAVGGKDTPVLPKAPDKNLLLIAGGLCLLALLVDYLQYVAGYLGTRKILAAGEKAGQTDFKYDYGAWTYRLRTVLFWLKQVLVVAGFLLLAFVVGAALLAK